MKRTAIAILTLTLALPAVAYSQMTVLDHKPEDVIRAVVRASSAVGYTVVQVEPTIGLVRLEASRDELSVWTGRFVPILTVIVAEEDGRTHVQVDRGGRALEGSGIAPAEDADNLIRHTIALLEDKHVDEVAYEPNWGTDVDGYDMRWPVRHEHSMGGCEGWLYIADDRIGYEARGNGKDSFEVTVEHIKDIADAMGANNRVKVDVREGRKYNFTPLAGATQEGILEALHEWQMGVASSGSASEVVPAAAAPTATPASPGKISAGALPPAVARIAAPEKLSESASWTGRTATGATFFSRLIQETHVADTRCPWRLGEMARDMSWERLS